MDFLQISDSPPSRRRENLLPVKPPVNNFLPNAPQFILPEINRIEARFSRLIDVRQGDRRSVF